MDIMKAQKFIYQNARPLDLARWQYLFENGSRENVLKYLAMYQNEDGGFGHALEADCWNPESSPIQTWAATEIIREIDLKEKEHPIIQGILRYLETEKDFDGHSWPNTIPSNARYPHAPWWNYDPSEEINYNPTASLIGFVLRCANPESGLYQTCERLLKEAYAYFKEHCPMESMHTVSCFVELYEDLCECGHDIIDLKEFESLLHMQIAHILTTDTSVWTTEYVCKPSLFIHSPGSRFYADNKELCDYECRFLSETQESDGTWAVTWDWGCFPEQWHISKNWWKTDLILKNIKFYQSMQGQISAGNHDTDLTESSKSPTSNAQSINLKAINEDNFIEAFNLKLADGQEKYVSHPIRSLAQAYVYREQCQPFGIYNGDKMVGYVMVIYDYDIPEYDIWHMMIDEKYQGQGFGRAALEKCLEYIKTKPFGDSDRICLTCSEANSTALHIYETMGFYPTGERDEEEIELVYSIR